MPAFPYSTLDAGFADAGLMIVVIGTVLIALTAHVLAAIGWLRRPRP
ncbi:MAG TPA: hypothetical protein VM910_02365 [Bradyrhizobium sp.]|jgi:hypothetical protein|nr:hypothetical protein [Bradyrhizobium sp.]